jgi:hypothetical protein
MKPVLIFLLLSVFMFSCKKSRVNTQQTCYKGRYVGEGCWPVIQLLEPLYESVPTAQYGSYKHVVGTGVLPERYKNGTVFYFTIQQIDSNKIYLTYCAPTKYFVTITPFDSACNADGN